MCELWNTVVDKQNTLGKRWNEMEKTGTELEALRAKQMRELANGGKITNIIPELVQTVLESITVKGCGQFEVSFMDGSTITILF